SIGSFLKRTNWRYFVVCLIFLFRNQMKSYLACLALGFLFPLAALSQTTVSGKITDMETGDPIPFANVIVLGLDVGAATDFEGNYSLSFDAHADSIKASYVGYESLSKKLTVGVTQTVSFQLGAAAYSLSEIVFEAGENPAYLMLRKFDAKK